MDNTPVMIFGIIFCLCPFGLYVYEGLERLYFCPHLCYHCFYHLRDEPLTSITDTFLSGTGNYLAQWFGLFMLGALFGKIMEASGAAASIARSVTD